MILDVLRLEEKVKAYEGSSTGSAKSSSELDAAGSPGEIGGLRKKLAEKERDIETLKKQSAGLSREYNELADKYNASNPGDKTPRKDM